MRNNDTECELKKLRLSNVNSIIVGYLNMNSLSGKFEQLEFLVKNKIDILGLNETKLDESFLSSRFLLDGFSKTFRLDRNQSGVGILIFVRNDILSRHLTKHNFPDDIEGLFIELNFRKTKWLFFYQ